MHYYPCVITQFRGQHAQLEVCVRWADPGTFKATCWLSLDQIRDNRDKIVDRSTLAKASVPKKSSVPKQSSVVKKLRGPCPGAK
jgi:hypothetical protein